MDNIHDIFRTELKVKPGLAQEFPHRDNRAPPQGPVVVVRVLGEVPQDFLAQPAVLGHPFGHLLREVGCVRVKPQRFFDVHPPGSRHKRRVSVRQEAPDIAEDGLVPAVAQHLAQAVMHTHLVQQHTPRGVVRGHVLGDDIAHTSAGVVHPFRAVLHSIRVE